MVKKYWDILDGWVTKNPVVAGGILLVVLAVVFFIGAWITQSITEYQARKHAEAQEQTRLELEQHKLDAEKKITEGQVVANQAERELTEAKEITKTVEKKKIKAKDAVRIAHEKHEKTVTSGNRTVDDIPTNGELCARANSLAVRCDEAQ